MTVQRARGANQNNIVFFRIVLMMMRFARIFRCFGSDAEINVRVCQTGVITLFLKMRNNHIRICDRTSKRAKGSICSISAVACW